MKKTMGLYFGLFGMLAGFAPVAAAEGDTGTTAYSFANYNDLAPTPKSYNLADYKGKVVLLAVFQYSCGGCKANAPTLGLLSDTLKSGQTGSNFQAVGAEISNATYAQIQSYRLLLVPKDSAKFSFPLVHVPWDTGISMNDPVGSKWHRYNSYRDVYFVISHEGKIVGRVDGNRGNAISSTLYKELRTSLDKALANVPTGILCLKSCGKNGLQAYRGNGGFHFSLGADAVGPYFVQILDLQGRIVRSFSIPAGAEAVWNGTGVNGSAPFGTYYLKATSAGFSGSQRISWLP